MFRWILKSCTGRVSHPFTATLRRIHGNAKLHEQQNSPVQRLSENLGRACRHSTVSVVDDLSKASGNDPEELKQVLRRHKLTRSNYHSHWLPVLVTQDVCATIQDLLASYSSGPSLDKVYPQPPIWVVLHLLCNRAQTHAEIVVALELVYHHLSTLSAEYRPVLLISTTLRLAELQIVAPLRYLVKSFFCLENEAHAEHYNHFLSALSLSPTSKETSTLAIAVMREMAARQYKISLHTYDMLLRRQFLTLDLVSAIERQMLAEGFTPMPRHLQAFLRVTSKHGHRRESARHLDALHQLLRSQKDGLEVPYASNPKNHKWASVKITDDNVVYLKSFRQFSHAFRHMGKLAKTELRPPRLNRRVLGTDDSSGETRSAGGPSSPIVGDTPLLNPKHGSEVAANTTGNSKWLPLRRSANAKLGVQEWLAGLYVASRDPTVTPERLIRSFRDGSFFLGSQLSISGFLVVIRGLMSKGDVTHAAELCEELRESNQGIEFNKVAVGVGVKVLTLNGEPYRAFALLEDVYSAQLEQDRSAVHEKDLQPKLTTITLDTINRFMISLQRLGRPDVVFELWDSMYTLYGLHPDACTLNCLLKAARWAKKYDNTIRGALARLGLRGRRPYVTQDLAGSDSRSQAKNRLVALLDPQGRISVDGMWGSQFAPNAALQVATHAFLHNYPELRAVHHPVRALRHSASSPALSPVSDAFHSILGSSSSEDQPDSTLVRLVGADGIPGAHNFASIIPTDITFRAYIDLLSTLNLTHEIPLVLAWMYTLGIFPSKTTLAAALVHWAEVGLDAPLIERLKGGPTRSPYAILKQWMMNWVGEGSMPGSVEMSGEMKRLAAFRDAGVGERISQRRVRRGRLGMPGYNTHAN